MSVANRNRPAVCTRDGMDIPSLALIDPSEFRRTCIAASLSSHGFSDIAQFDSAAAIAEGAEHDLALLFLDGGSDSSRHLEAEIERLTGRSPRLRIVVVVDEPTEFIRQNGDRSGTIRAVLSGSMEPELLSAVLCVIHRGYRVFPILENGLLRHTAPRPNAVRPVLSENHPLLARTTARQREVLSALLAGCANKDIAELLSISESTVKTHVHYLMRILGASNRTQLVLKLAFDGTAPAQREKGDGA